MKTIVDSVRTILTILVVVGRPSPLAPNLGAAASEVGIGAEDGVSFGGGGGQRFLIEGKVSIPYTTDQDWVPTTRVVLDGGQYLGFLKNDGSFTASVPSGSYTIDIAHPFYVFDSIRVDITSKGKIRARRLNNIQPSLVLTIPYPLKIKAKGRASYFQQREQWRITDFLFSPMVLTMFLPFVLLMILPKLINTQDPETQREMQQTMGILNPKQSLPELSEVFTKIFGGGNNAKKAAKSKPAKKRS